MEVAMEQGKSSTVCSFYIGRLLIFQLRINRADYEQGASHEFIVLQELLNSKQNVERRTVPASCTAVRFAARVKKLWLQEAL